MVTAYTAFDALVVALIALLGVVGLARGFVGELASLGAWIAGVLAIRFFHVPAKSFMQTMVESETMAAALALIGLFLAAFIAVRLIGNALSRSTKSSVISPIDRLLGLGFGLAKGTVAAVLMFLLTNMSLEFLGPKQDQPIWFANSRSAPVLAIFSRALVDFVDEQRRTNADVASEDPHAGLGFPARDSQGYNRRQRSALDELLDEQEKTTPSTPI